MNNLGFHKVCDDLCYNFRVSYLLSRVIPASMRRDVGEWLRDNSLRHKICEECGELNALVDGDNNIDAVQIYERWHEIFFHVCYYLGINKKTAKALWEKTAYESWGHSLQMKVEQCYNREKWCTMFYCGVLLCCSDGWSFTRLMRCHWLFKQWYKKIQNEDN